jgi:uncharacterized protein YndB with AHSA1/START domain
MVDRTLALAVRQSVLVQAPLERAFTVFTAALGTWWPLESHHIGASPAATAVIEPRVGGRWYERAADGTECDWGHVRAWDPPRRVVLSWEISCDWRHDPGVDSEVEVRFVPVDAGSTRVELEHRGLETYGEQAEDMRRTFDSPGGWRGLLERYSAAALGPDARP